MQWYKDDFFKAYVECALWSSTDESGDPLDDNYNEGDIAPDSITTMRRDCDNFVDMANELLTGVWTDPRQAGHDFWLTRNGHGAGFWDRGEPNGDALTKIAHSYGECYLLETGDGGLFAS